MSSFFKSSSSDVSSNYALPRDSKEISSSSTNNNINSSSNSISSKFYSSFSLSATARSAVSAASSAASVASSAASVAASSAASVASSVAHSATLSSTSSSSSSLGSSSSSLSLSSSAANSNANSKSSLTSLPLSSSKIHASNVGGMVKKDKDELIENDIYVEYLKELRMNYEYADEKIAIFDRFYSLLEPGILYLSLEAFVIDSKKRGHSVQWADAAFRAVDMEKRGSLNKFEYLFAVISLQLDERFMKNARWLELRRKLVFTYYDRGEKGYMVEDDYTDFVRDASMTTDEPESVGIANKKWSVTLQSYAQLGGHDIDTLGQELAAAKLEIVQKQSELEELHLLYIQLEKKYCGLKLELAATRELIDNRDT